MPAIRSTDCIKRSTPKEKRIANLVNEKHRLEKELAQAKLELKLERQNKFATNAQQNADEANDAEDEDASPMTDASLLRRVTEETWGPGRPSRLVSSDSHGI